MVAVATATMWLAEGSLGLGGRSATAAVVAQGSSGPELESSAEPAASREEYASRRRDAAEASASSEAARIAAAQEWRVAQGSDQPAASMLVSLAEPLPLQLLMDTYPESAVDVTSVFTWLSTEDSLFPIWGVVDLTQPGSRVDTAARLGARQATYLEQRRAKLEKLAATEEEEERAATLVQVDYLAQLQELLDSEGVQIYGFACEGTIQDVDALAESGGLALRVIEPASTGFTPIPPSDELRDELREQMR